LTLFTLFIVLHFILHHQQYNCGLTILLKKHLIKLIGLLNQPTSLDANGNIPVYTYKARKVIATGSYKT